MPLKISSPRNLRGLSRAILAAGLLLAGACHKAPGVSAPPAAPSVPGPEPFTARLPEVEGVQAILSLRPPTLVNLDLKKMMVGVPEASLLRMMLFRLSEYGYPDFEDVASGSNAGVVLLSASAEDVKGKKWVPVGFAKIKEGGKIWNLLEARHVAHLKRGDWVMFAKTYADLGKLESPDPVIAYLEQPQAEDIRVWGRVTPELLAGFRESIAPLIKSKLADLPPARATAITGYLGVFYSMAPQIHSLGLSLSLTDNAIRLAYSVQFLPESTIGKYLRYKPGPQPAVARYVSSNAFLSMEARQDPSAFGEMANSVIDSLLQVDYPPVSARLREFKAAYQGYAAAADGGSAAAFDLSLSAPNGSKGLRTESFTVVSGHFTRDVARQYFKGLLGLVGKGLTSTLASFKPAAPADLTVKIKIRHAYVEDAVTVDGIPFDSLAITSDLNGSEISKSVQFVGVVGGNLVIADNEPALRSRLPALIAGLPLADGVGIPLEGDDQILANVSGGKILDLIVGAAKLDPADEDSKAQVKDLAAEFAAAGPIRWTLAGSQAKATATFTIPYKFVEAGVHFGQWVATHRQVLAALAPVPAQTPPANVPLPDDDQPMPVPLNQ